MTDMKRSLSILVGGATAAILLAGTVKETHDALLRHTQVAPMSRAPSGFIRADFDFGEIAPAATCQRS